MKPAQTCQGLSCCDLDAHRHDEVAAERETDELREQLLRDRPSGQQETGADKLLRPKDKGFRWPHFWLSVSLQCRLDMMSFGKASRCRNTFSTQFLE